MNVQCPRRLRLLAIGCAPMVASMAMAAAPAASTTYSLTRPAATAKDMAVTIIRDGTRETIKLSRANGWHSQMWFDFDVHKQYANDSNAPGQCSVIAYTSDGPPGMLDPVPGAFAMAAEIPANAPAVGKEKLGNLDTRVIDAGGGGKIWIDDAHHLVVKARLPFETDGKMELTTMVDVTGIRFDEPAAALLTPPTGCKQTQGSANANGGHAETPLH